MTEHKHDDEQIRLPLPSPHSPAALDEKILAYGAENAPQRPSRRPGPWIAGLATAGIVGAAVMISLPQETPAPLIQPIDEIAISAPAAARSAAPAAKMSQLIMADRELSYEAANASAAPAAALASSDADLADALSDSASAFAGVPLAQLVPRLSSESTAVLLDALQELLRSGATEEASARYQYLREACADCELPDTLEQALQDRLPRDQSTIAPPSETPD